MEEELTEGFCQAVLETPLPRNEGLVLEDEGGVLCRQKTTECDLTQIVSDASLHWSVIKRAHHNPRSGHPGKTGQHDRLRRVFYWPQLAANISPVVC